LSFLAMSGWLISSGHDLSGTVLAGVSRLS
jgi:hypothetical protein